MQKILLQIMLYKRGIRIAKTCFFKIIDQYINLAELIFQKYDKFYQESCVR